MMEWNYQIMRYGPFDDEPKYSYGIHEYYVFADGTKSLWTEEAVGVTAESIEEIRNILENMLEDLANFGIRDYDTGELI